MATKKERFKTIYSKKEDLAGVHYCTDHTGKMQGIPSVSTSCLASRICASRRNIEGSICKECFSFAMMTGIYRSGNMANVYAENYRILTSGILDDSAIPLFGTVLGRIESFGDINNWIQAANYIKIIRRNPMTRFGWWTKNPQFIQEAIDRGYRLPPNVSIVQSSMMKNRQDDVTYPFVSKLFTCYDKDYLKQHPEVDINCGARSCMLCQRCYLKNKRGIKVEIINETVNKR